MRSSLWASPFTYVVFVTFHVVSEGGAAELVGAEEAKVTGHLSGDGGGQTLEEALRTLVPHDGFHHRPHSALDGQQGRRTQCTHYNTNILIY